MNYSDELLFFFSALGAFNGLLMGGYFLFFAQPSHPPHKFLGAFLIAISIRVGKSVFFYFDHNLHGAYLQFGLTACLFIGPFLYFYYRTALQDEKWQGWKYQIPALFLAAAIVNYSYPFEVYYELWQAYIIPSIYGIWLLYLFLCAFVLKGIFRKLWTRETKMTSDETWMISIFIGTFLIWVAYNTCPYTSYISGALTFSFVIYLLGLFMFLNRKKRPNEQDKYAGNKIGEREAKVLFQQLELLMQEEKLYTNPNLKLSDVAKKMNILPHRLSQLLNAHLDKNFPAYINSYRIKAAKAMIQVRDELTLEAIGYECGFNSKSSFYATFKKVTGTTPAKFRRMRAETRPEL